VPTILFLSLTASTVPCLVGLLLAVAAVLVPRNRWPAIEMPPGIRYATAVGAGAALALTVAETALDLARILTPVDVMPYQDHLPAQRLHLLAPLIAGLVALVVIALPRTPSEGGGTAPLSRRTATTFVARPWLIILGVLAAAAGGLAVAGGLASTRDAQGRWAVYEVDMGSAWLGTEIYGWYASVPGLILIAALLGLAAAATVRISRAPWGVDPEGDASGRRQRTTAILAVASGALLLHLGVVLHSLAATAMLRGSVSIGDAFFRAGSSFSALAAPMRALGTTATVAGWALWGIVLLACLVGPRLDARRDRKGTSWRRASR